MTIEKDSPVDDGKEAKENDTHDSDRHLAPPGRPPPGDLPPGYRAVASQMMPFPLTKPMNASKLHLYFRSDHTKKHRRDLVRAYLKNWLEDNDFTMSLNATYKFFTQESEDTLAENELNQDMVLG